MSLFIGNVPRSVEVQDLLSIFMRYGKCSVDIKGNSTFIDFDHLKSAECAIEELQGSSVLGFTLKIEWSKKTAKRTKIPEPSNTSRNISKSEILCYYCREQGHISKDCKYRAENSMGHTQKVDLNALVEHVRKLSSSSSRIRIKSPLRYSKVAGKSFNIVNLG
jgi:RNA recognition motif-containing protein